MVDLSAFKYQPQEPTSNRRPKRELDGVEEGGRSRKARKSENDWDWDGPLIPVLRPGLKIVFVGFNPGMESARTGRYYAHHSNRFWKFLFWSGLTPTIYDQGLPDKKYGIGFTDLVARATTGIKDLTRDEMDRGVNLLDDRIARVKPKVVCLVGKGIWEAIARVRGWDRKKFKYGRDDEHMFGEGASILCCVPSTSGLNSINIEKQLGWWKEVVSLTSEEPASEDAAKPSSPEKSQLAEVEIAQASPGKDPPDHA